MAKRDIAIKTEDGTAKAGAAVALWGCCLSGSMNAAARPTNRMNRMSRVVVV